MEKKKKINKTLLYFILIILTSGIIYCIYQIMLTIKDNQTIEKETINIKKDLNIITTDISEGKLITNEKEKLTLDFTKLKQINEDTIGWIKVSNTNIDYPIVKTNNNDYYLNHSFYKNENRNGWIFANSENNTSFTDANTVLFGHNTNSKTMFSELKDIYKGILGTNITITIYLENNILNYKVFAIYLEKPEQTKSINKYINQDIIDEIIQKSKINFNISVTETDKILTLSTCNNTTEDRIIMHAKQNG